MVNFTPQKGSILLDSILHVTEDMHASNDPKTIAAGASGMLQNAVVWLPPLVSEQGYTHIQISSIFAHIQAILSFSLSTSEDSLSLAIQWIDNLREVLTDNA